MDGLLLIDKPKGWTSFDVVAKVRGVLQKEGVTKPKVGHTGTLDPLATGLLVLTLGSYCKRAAEFSKLDKTYEVEMILGKTSTTDDAEGQITETKYPKNTPLFLRSDIFWSTAQEVIMSFVGEIEQVPPAFSAIKIDGKRAYKLAREGKTVELKPRTVIIHSIEKITIPHYKDSPCKVFFTTKVSSGTYIRSLVRDIGEKLGTGAYMSELRRTEVGEFKLQNAVSNFDNVEKSIITTI